MPLRRLCGSTARATGIKLARDNIPNMRWTLYSKTPVTTDTAARRCATSVLFLRTQLSAGPPPWCACTPAMAVLPIRSPNDGVAGPEPESIQVSPAVYALARTGGDVAERRAGRRSRAAHHPCSQGRVHEEDLLEARGPARAAGRVGGDGCHRERPEGGLGGRLEQRCALRR